MRPDPVFDFLVRPTALPPGQPGVLLSVSPDEAGWQTLGFTVRRLAGGETLTGTTGEEEAVIVVLSGRLDVDWGEGSRPIGGRDSVFGGYPWSVYLPRGITFSLRADTLAEFADSRVRSRKPSQPRIVTPGEVGDEIRGGGNTTRQILRIIRPEDDADRLMVNEVYTPAGNWSSYPPHKHDTQDLPQECDLDELYYFRVDHPHGFGFLRVYDSAGARDVTVVVRDGDLGLLREGYHLVAAAPGYRLYYLAVLAGTSRSLAARVDPRFDHLRGTWPAPDTRVPVVHRS